MSRGERIFQLLAGVLMLAAGLPESSGAGSAIPELARNLAENVLPGSVQSVRTNGSNLAITWESATYRPGNSRAQTKELLYTEAELATGSVMGRLQEINAVDFFIVRRGSRLAGGINARGTGITLTFAAQLGGGPYTLQPAASLPQENIRRSGPRI